MYLDHCDGNIWLSFGDISFNMTGLFETQLYPRLRDVQGFVDIVAIEVMRSDETRDFPDIWLAASRAVRRHVANVHAADKVLITLAITEALRGTQFAVKEDTLPTLTSNIMGGVSDPVISFLPLENVGISMTARPLTIAVLGSKLGFVSDVPLDNCSRLVHQFTPAPVTLSTWVDGVSEVQPIRISTTPSGEPWQPNARLGADNLGQTLAINSPLSAWQQL